MGTPLNIRVGYLLYKSFQMLLYAYGNIVNNVNFGTVCEILWLRAPFQSRKK